jgi:hypothetical protein
MESSNIDGFFDSSILEGTPEPEKPREDSLPPLPTEGLTQLREKQLYERALDVYEEIFDSGNLKLQKEAAKEVVAAYHKRLEHESRSRMSGSNIIAIGNDALREALKRAAHGIEGGISNATERKAEPVGVAAEWTAEGDKE